jgi:hypothetical protein
MAEFAFDVPTEAEVADATSGIEHLMTLESDDQLDLCPYLVRLLLQLEELLVNVPSKPVVGVREAA